MAAIVAAWLVPYSLSGPAAALGDRLAAEVATRTAGHGAGGIARHLLTYPFVVLGSGAPWSLAVLGLATAAGRARLSALRADPALFLSGAVVAWGVLVFLSCRGR